MNYISIQKHSFTKYKKFIKCWHGITSKKWGRIQNLDGINKQCLEDASKYNNHTVVELVILFHPIHFLQLLCFCYVFSFCIILWYTYIHRNILLTTCQVLKQQLKIQLCEQTGHTTAKPWTAHRSFISIRGGGGGLPFFSFHASHFLFAVRSNAPGFAAIKYSCLTVNIKRFIYEQFVCLTTNILLNID